MREQLTCPQCGAPITGTECKFCGAIFYDFSTLSMDKPCYIRLKTGKFINIFKAIVTRADFNIERSNDTVLYCDDNPYVTINAPKYSLDISMDILDDDGIFLTRKEIENG